MRHIGDLVVQYQLNKMIKIGINVVYGEDKKNTDTAAATWGGAAGYLSITPIDGLTISYRADYFDDRKGARGLLGTPTKVLGHTVTGTISMYGGHFLIRPEVKYDKSDVAVFGAVGDRKTDNITALLSFTGVY